MMDFRDLLEVFRRSILLVVGGALIGAAVGGIGAIRRAAPTASVIVSIRSEGWSGAPASAVTYDGYYVVETERRFGAILGEILRDAEVREQMLRETGAVVGRVERVTPLDFRVAFSGVRGEAPKLPSALESILRDRMRAFAERTGEPLLVTAVVTPLFVPAGRSSAISLILAGAIVGLILAMTFVLLRHRSENPPPERAKAQ